MLHDGDLSWGILGPSRPLCHNYTLLACYQTLAHRRLAPNLHSMMTPPPPVWGILWGSMLCVAWQTQRTDSEAGCHAQHRPGRRLHNPCQPVRANALAGGVPIPPPGGGGGPRAAAPPTPPALPLQP